MNKKIVSAALVSTLAWQNVHAQLFNSITTAQSQANTATETVSANQNALDSYLRNTKDLQASFTQTVLNSRGQQQSQGQMWLSKPGKFYWDYQSPDKQKIISNGEKVWQYDIDLAQIAVRKKDDLVGDIAVKILTGQGNVNDQFSVTTIAGTQAPILLKPMVKNADVYRLTPKQNQEGYDSVYVVMQNNNLKAIAIDAGRGQQTLISFSNLKRNVGIPASKFDFTPPKGVDVVGE